jgi:hypothetical protein
MHLLLPSPTTTITIQATRVPAHAFQAVKPSIPNPQTFPPLYFGSDALITLGVKTALGGVVLLHAEDKYETEVIPSCGREVLLLVKDSSIFPFSNASTLRVNPLN